MIFFSGILSGLAAACCFALAYLFSKLFYEKSGKNPLHLLAISQLQMGIVALLVLPFAWSSEVQLSLEIILPLAGVTLFGGILGQASFFLTLKYSNPSQVTPLLALKIVLLAFASIVFLRKNIALLQWISIGMCFGATFMLHFSGEPIPVKTLLGVLVTCIGYALGDVFVTMLIEHLEMIGVTNPALLGACFVYAALGMFGLILVALTWKDIRTFSVWKFAFYFSLVFFVADVFLFTTFKLVGPVFGNILQSVRGILSIILAKIVAKKGMFYLEEDIGSAVMFRRLFAAFLFSVAIALYVI
ncbi:MAG: EamA family transporter [Proteobacteria bacterium]|nr:EamA family transporter [Pseudomonadota bacterium]